MVASLMQDCWEEGRGVRQGWCPLSPLLFIIYVVRESMDNVDEGIKVGGDPIKAFRYVYDQALLVGS